MDPKNVQYCAKIIWIALKQFSGRKFAYIKIEWLTTRYILKQNNKRCDQIFFRWYPLITSLLVSSLFKFSIVFSPLFSQIYTSISGRIVFLSCLNFQFDNRRKDRFPLWNRFVWCKTFLNKYSFVKCFIKIVKSFYSQSFRKKYDCQFKQNKFWNFWEWKTHQLEIEITFLFNNMISSRDFHVSLKVGFKVPIIF